jgi:hypothetical protein
MGIAGLEHHQQEMMDENYYTYQPGENNTPSLQFYSDHTPDN